MGQQFPCAAAANRVTDPIHDLAACVFGSTPAGFGYGNERFRAIPFRISEIRIVGWTVVHVDRPRDDLFKRALRKKVYAGQELIKTVTWRRIRIRGESRCGSAGFGPKIRE